MQSHFFLQSVIRIDGSWHIDKAAEDKRILFILAVVMLAMSLSIADGFKFGVGFVVCLIVGELLCVAISLMLFSSWIRSLLQ